MAHPDIGVRDVLSVDQFINELTISVTLEESLGNIISDDGESLLEMDIHRIQKLWDDISQPKLKVDVLDTLISKLASIKHERVVMRILWGFDLLIEKRVFSPHEIALALVRCDRLRLEHPVLFRCAFKLLLKLIFYLDYKSNREVFNKSIEKAAQFSDYMSRDRNLFRAVDPAVELIQLLLCREICLMPAYFAMHELIRNFPGDFTDDRQLVQSDFESFMNSFKLPASLLYSQVYHEMTPFCGLTPLTAPGFRLDSSSLVLTSIKGAMRYPDFLTNAQLPLLCQVLGQLRSTELTVGMLDSSAGKTKMRSGGLEMALVDLIIQVMELTEQTNNAPWIRDMFEHMISVTITFMLSTTIRFNEIVAKLNGKLEGRTWSKANHYVMWFVLNATSGFIGKNMLTDFVSCLRLFDLLFPNVEDPDKAIDLHIPGCRVRCSAQEQSDAVSTNAEAVNPDCRTLMDIDSIKVEPTVESPFEMIKRETDETERLVDEPEERCENGYSTCSSADESDDEVNPAETEDFLPPSCHNTPSCLKRRERLLHLATAPVCLWQHVLRKSRLGQDHLPRSMPPALRPIEARISRRMQALVDCTNPQQAPAASISLASKLTWSQLFVVLNAYSTDNEISQQIQRLVDLFWISGNETTSPEADLIRFWPKLLKNGSVKLPYGLVAHGRLKPLSNHLIRAMSVHLRMLVLYRFLRKFNVLQNSDQLTTPAVIETFCRILACREVEANYVNNIFSLLLKLQPVWVNNQQDKASTAQNSQNPSGKTVNLPITNERVPNYPACALISTLLDMLGYRLADVLPPEVRMNALLSLVNRSRSWSRYYMSSTNNLESKSPKDYSVESGCNSSIPLELSYMLDWTILKFIRSLQAPDCVIYGLCATISSAMSVQSQTSNLPPNIPGHAGQPVGQQQQQQPKANNMNVTNITASVASNTAGLTTTMSGRNPSLTGRTAGVPGPNAPPSLAQTSDTNATFASSHLGTTASVAPGTGMYFTGSVAGYPSLMTDRIELNRFILFSLLQTYYTFDLEEVSGLHSYLADQTRFVSEPLNMNDLPQIIYNRLPDFLRLTRQLISSNQNPPSDFNYQDQSKSMSSSSPSVSEKSRNLARLPYIVQEEYKRLTADENPDWMSKASEGNLFFCLLLRHLANTSNLPKTVYNLIVQIPISLLNTCVRLLCDYVVACIGLATPDQFMGAKCLFTLSEFCIRWRIVPLDRFLLFLLMHTNYQGPELEAVNCIIVYLFTQSDLLKTGFEYLTTQFNVDLADYQPNDLKGMYSNCLHPDPISSRSWTSCTSYLHELIPDQWIFEPESVDELNSPDQMQNLPVLYGHMLLRLLPLLEVILAQFLETDLPLIHLIPFCSTIAPLFRFHRRPVNTCFVLIREQWQLVTPNLLENLPDILVEVMNSERNHMAMLEQYIKDNLTGDEPSTDLIRWILNRFSTSVVIHSILWEQHKLARKSTNIRLGKLGQGRTGAATASTDGAGLLSCQAAKQLDKLVRAAQEYHGQVMNKYCYNWCLADTDTLNTAQLELQSLLLGWYQSNRQDTLNLEYITDLIDPLWSSTKNYGLSGHPAAWRPWNFEENVCIQSAGLYAAAVEIMSLFALPVAITSAIADFLTVRSSNPTVVETLNALGALIAVLPNVHRNAIFNYCVGLFNDPFLLDSTPDLDWTTSTDSLPRTHDMIRRQWKRSNRIRRHTKLLKTSLIPDNPNSNSNMMDTTEMAEILKPPKVAVDFFKIVLPQDLPPKADSNGINSGVGGAGTANSNGRSTTSDRSAADSLQNALALAVGDNSYPFVNFPDYWLRSSLWHAIWSHANTTHLTSLASIFSALIVPCLRNEVQLLMAFYLVAPLMGSLHVEKPMKLIDLTEELYHAVSQVDSYLAKNTGNSVVDTTITENTTATINDENENPESTDVEMKTTNDSASTVVPNETGTPLVHADTITDLLYHIKYMYVGNGVQNKVKSLLPQLRPSLRKRLKFIVPASDFLLPNGQQQQQTHTDKPVFEGRVYHACVKPPMSGEDF